MVVTCEQCLTRFQLDEQLFKGKRAKVRCSRCQHTFVVSLAGPLEDGTAPGPLGDMDLPQHLEEPEPTGEVEPPHPSEEEVLGWLSQSAEAEDESEPHPQPLPEPAALAVARPSPAEDTAAPSPAAAPAAPEAPRKRKKWGLYLGLAGGLMAIFLCSGLGWWYYKQHLATRKSPAPAAATATPAEPAAGAAPTAAQSSLQELEIDQQEVRYRGLTNKTGGQVLVIQGKVTNKSPQLRGPVQLRLTLMDTHNQAVSQRTFYAGSTFTDEELQNLTAEEINRWLETPGGRLQGRVLKAGGAQPFTAVLFGVPPNLAEGGYGYNLQVLQAPVAVNP